MINTFKYLKYSILLPLLFIQFSCDTTEPQDCAGVANGTATIDACGVCGGSGVDTDSDGICDTADSFPTVNNATLDLSDFIGSWKLTGLTGIYTYTVSIPTAASGLTWPADTSFGIRLKWEHEDYAAFGGALAGQATFPLPTPTQPTGKHVAGDIVLYQVATYDLATLVDNSIGLVGVFEDAPSAGADATYKMKGTYPGVFYNYGLCASAGSTAPMTDQGLYTWNQTATTENFVIKRDPDISGSQVLPTFADGDLTLVDANTLNIKFLDRDAHSTLYVQIMDAWDEGKHPDNAYGGNGINSGGDRTYFAFPPLIATNGVFTAPLTDPTTQTAATEGYLYGTGDNMNLTAWGGFMTWYAFCFLGELTYLTATNGLTDIDSDGDKDATDLVMTMAGNQSGTTHGTALPYSTLVSAAGAFTNDSDHDVELTNLAAGGKMTFNTISDCAVPVDVTIDFDATFTRCTTDNCVGDSYHITPIWD